MKKFLAMALALLMAAVLLPVTAMAAETVENVTSKVITAATTQEELNAWLGEDVATMTDNGDGTYTMTLYKNLVLGTYQDIKFGNYVDGVSQAHIILDLNGCTITGTSIPVANLGNLTIKDSSSPSAGAIIYNGGAYLGAVQNAGYNLTIEGGSFISNSASSPAASAVNTTGGAKTVINGGSFQAANGSAVFAYGEVTINGGSFTGNYGIVTAKTSYDDTVYGKVLIPADSDVTVDATTLAVGRISSSGTIAISSGSYSNDVSAYIPEGLQELIKDSGTTPYNVGTYTDESAKAAGAEAKTSIKNRTVYFVSTADALNNDAVTNVTLLDNTTLTEVPEGKTVTVPAGVTVTASGDLSNVTFEKDAKLIVPEGQTATLAGGKQVSSGTYNAVSDNNLKTGSITVIIPDGDTTDTTTTTETTKNPATGTNDFVGAAVALAVISVIGAAAVVRKK